MVFALTEQQEREARKNTDTLSNARLDDAALMALLARDKREALSELYDRYGRLVYSIALNSVGDQASAEEIVQDVFTHVWEKAYTYDARIAKVSTWLINITRHRAIDELRKRNVRAEKASISWAEVEEWQQWSSSKLPGPELETEFSLQQKKVREAVKSLSPEQQEVLALAYFKGYTHSEIAKVLDIPLGTVKARIRLAMQKLRFILNQAMVDDL